MFTWVLSALLSSGQYINSEGFCRIVVLIRDWAAVVSEPEWKSTFDYLRLVFSIISVSFSYPSL